MTAVSCAMESQYITVQRMEGGSDVVVELIVLVSAHG